MSKKQVGEYSPRTQEFVDGYILRQIKLHRVFEGEAIRRANEVQKMRDAVLAKIKRDYGLAKSSDINRLNKEIADLIIDSYKRNVIPGLKRISSQVIIKEADWNTKIIRDNIEKTVDQEPVKINPVNTQAIADTAFNKTYQGHTFKYWFDAGSSAYSKGVQSILSGGYVAGKTTDEITTEVADFLGRSKRDVATLTRSYLSSVAADTRSAMFANNADIFEGFIWVSVLDNRTTPHICGVRDGKLYDMDHNPVGHDLSWGAGPGKIHWNCRSTFVPKLPGMDFGDVDRPAINAGPEYERGDNTTSTGKVRKPTKANRDKGIYKVTEVSGATDYESFLKRQPKAFVADILGSEQKAEEFLSGKITLRSFASETTPLGIDKL